MTTPPNMADQPHSATETASLSGRWVVLALLALGVLASAGIWIWWKVRMAPYVPLRQAIGEAFPKSFPRVEGGRTRSSPPTLRISVDVDFPPLAADRRVAPMLRTIVQLTKQHLDLSPYEILEVYLSQRVPERTPIRLLATYRMSHVRDAPVDHVPEGELKTP